METMTLLKVFQPFYCEDLVRLGKDYDGGYLVSASDVAKTKQVVSLGIGTDWSFEKDFLDINPCPLNAYDKSVNTTTDDYKKFFVNSTRHFSADIGTGTDTVAIEVAVTQPDTFLKCDIEGSEYNLLDYLIEISPKLTGLVIEFHEINKPEHFNSLVNFISKIEQKLVHIHVNNWLYYKTEREYIPTVIELTFSSSDALRYDASLSLPHPLDMPNNPQGKDFILTF